MIEATVIALRAIQYAAAVVALGLPLFHIYARETSETRGLSTLAVPACILLALAALAGVAAQTAMMAGDWSAAFDPTALSYVVQSTGLGTANIVRSGLAIIGAGLLIVARKTSEDRVASLWPAVIVLSGAVISLAWSGHGAATEGAAGLAHLVSDAVHSLAAAVWIGALFGFLVLLRRSNKAIEGTTRALIKFATIGTATVAVLVVTGLVNTVVLVGADGLGELLSSAWGQVLAAKLVLFTVMLGLAAHNRFNLTPALAGAADAGDRDVAVRRLRRSVGLEALAGMALLVLVAVLGVQMPPGAM